MIAWSAVVLGINSMSNAGNNFHEANQYTKFEVHAPIPKNNWYLEEIADSVIVVIYRKRF